MYRHCCFSLIMRPSVTSRTKIARKSELSSSIPVKWCNSCNCSLFAGMTLTLHKRQVHCSGAMQWWTCSSLMYAFCLQRQVAKFASVLFYCRGHQLLWNCELLPGYRLKRRATSFIHTSEIKILLNLPSIILVFIFVNAKTLNFEDIENANAIFRTGQRATWWRRAPRWWPLFYWIGFHCVIIALQRIFKGSLQVTLVTWLLHIDIFDR